MSGGQRDPEAIKNMTAVACVLLCVSLFYAVAWWDGWPKAEEAAGINHVQLDIRVQKFVTRCCYTSF